MVLLATLRPGWPELPANRRPLPSRCPHRVQAGMSALQDKQEGGRTGFQAGMGIGNQRSLRTSKRSSAAADHPPQVRGAGVHATTWPSPGGFLGEDGVLLEDVRAVVALPAQVPDDHSDIDIAAAERAVHAVTDRLGVGAPPGLHLARRGPTSPAVVRSSSTGHDHRPLVRGATSTHERSVRIRAFRLLRVQRDQGVDIGLKIGDPQPRCPFHVDQRQPPRGDESFDRPYRYPELIRGLCLRDQ